MNVVSNTSPLTNLATIGQFSLLNELYCEVHIAEGVWMELNAHGKAWPGAKEVDDSGWISKHPVENQDLVLSLRRDLDRGEAESIALARELEADMILIDEQEGRHLAGRLGLRVVGVLEILLEAKQAGLIEQVRPLLDDLRQTAGFYIDDTIYRSTLQFANEVPDKT